MDHRSIEAWPFESTKRSRLGQMGSFGSNRIIRFQMVYTNGARAIGVPGCPDLACCTASIESVRIVLIANLVISSSVIVFLRRFCLFFLCLQRSYFAQATQMSRRLTELGCEKRLNEIPGNCWSDSPAAHTKNVH